MAEKEVKTRVGISGEDAYKEACKNINNNLKEMRSEMKYVTAEYKDNANSTEALRAKQNVLNKEFEEQKKKVAETEAMLKKYDEAGQGSSEAAQKLRTALNYQKAELAGTSNEIKKTADAMQNADKDTGTLDKDMKNLGNTAADNTGKFDGFTEKLKNIAGVIGKGAVAIGTAAAGAASGLAAMTVSAAGTADDLGTMSVNTGISTDNLQKYKYALNFVDGDLDTLTKTMNKQSLQMVSAANGNKNLSAEYEKLGVSLKNADGSFRNSEDVYWDVIDGLKGVKDETERNAMANDLLGKSSKDLRTVIEAGSKTFKSYGQEAENMGIIMSEQNVEAFGKFQDKLDTLSAAMGGLKNAGAAIALPFLDELAGNGIQLLGQFTKGIQDANGDMGKMATVIGDTLSGAVKLIAEKLPEFMQMGITVVNSLVSGITENLPVIINGAIQIISALGQGIMQILPQLLSAALQIVITLANGLADALPTLIPQIVNMMLYIVQTLLDNLPKLIDAALRIIQALAEGLIAALPVLAEQLPQIIIQIITTLTTELPKIIACGADIITALVDGLIQALPILIEYLPQIVIALVTGIAACIPQILKSGKQIVETLINALKELPALLAATLLPCVTKLVEWGEKMKENAQTIMLALVNAIIQNIKDLPAKMWAIFLQCVTKVAEWGSSMKTKAEQGMAAVGDGIINAFTSLPSKMADIGKNLVQGLWNGINDATGWIIDKIKSFGDAVMNGLKDFFGIKSPSTKMRDEVGKFLAQGIGVGFTDEMARISQDMQAAIPTDFTASGTMNYTSTGTQQGNDSTGSSSGVHITQNIYANETSYAEQQKQAAKQYRLIARTV